MNKALDHVTMVNNPTYSPYKNLKRENVGREDTGVVESMTLKSEVITTVSGRKVYRPKSQSNSLI